MAVLVAAKLVVFGGAKLDLDDQALMARLHPSVEEILMIGELTPRLLASLSRSKDILCASIDREGELRSLKRQGFNTNALRFKAQRNHLKLIEVLRVMRSGSLSIYRPCTAGPMKLA